MTDCDVMLKQGWLWQFFPQPSKLQISSAICRESKKKKKGSYKKRERKKTHNSNSVPVSSCPIRKRVSRSYSLESLHFSDLGLVSARKLQRNRSSQKS
ncbi:hypothetical protein MRB53_021917 [Persea americana]|uniref:Uncharacterized protein n=1 Tax=Persea americana TaxID=3435 RepID=A0ACC2L592_PERAE|nr:hypothetical protein MRB53_021917 [Persea americana]